MTLAEDNNFNAAVKKMKNIVLELESDTGFEQQLRRAICNSDYFHTSFSIRLKKRLRLDGVITLPLVSASLLSGLFLAMLVQFAVFGAMDAVNSSKHTANKTIELSPSSDTASLVQNLYKEGALVYTKEEIDGTRHYQMTTRDNAVYEVIDKKPYAINYFTINH